MTEKLYPGKSRLAGVKSVKLGIYLYITDVSE